MPEIRVTVAPYQGSMVFDLHASGQNVVTAEMGEEIGLYGKRHYTVFEVKPDHMLEFTLKKCRGDVEITLPDNWDCFGDTISFNDMNVRLPRVSLQSEGRRTLGGYVTNGSLHLRFEQRNDQVIVEMD